MMPPNAPSTPGAPGGPQLGRLVRLLQWLRSGHPFTAREAARAFEVSTRTVYQDIRYLKTARVPIAFDARKNSYVLTEAFDDFPLATLRHSDVAALLGACAALHAFGDVPFAETLHAVVETLARHLPPSMHVEPHALGRLVRYELDPAPKQLAGPVRRLREAVDAQRAVRIRYRAASTGETTERTVEPYAVLSHQGRWYVIGHCRLRAALRDFRIDRIATLEVTREGFAIPPDFDLDAYLSPSFGMTRGEATCEVRVRFSPYQARWIREERWHPSQLMTERADGSLEVRLRVAGLADVARWVLSYGAEAEVLAPRVLRERVAREARRLDRLYSGSQRDE